MPARLVILLNRQLSASLLYWRPSSWQKTRLSSCHAYAGCEPLGALARPMHLEGIDSAPG